jgi:hypothetical protein
VTVLSMPAIAAQELVWALQSNTQTFSSPISQITQTAEMAGARWTARLTFKNKSASDHRAWLAFGAQLRGASGRCYLSPAFAYPRVGAGGGSPVVNGGSQTGNTLVIKNAAHSITGWLKAGDFFSFASGTGYELKICTSDASTDGSGAVTLTFEPPIRVSPSDSAAIEITSPQAVMRLADDSQVSWTISPPALGAATMQFVESFPS